MYVNEKQKSHQESIHIETAAFGAFAFIDVHTYIFAYTYIYKNMYTHTHKYIYIYIYSYIHTYMNTYIYIYIHIYIFIHTYIHTCIYIYICMYTCVCIYIYIHTCINIHSYMYTYNYVYTRWAYHAKNSWWNTLLKYLSPNMVHHIFENFDSKMVEVTTSRLWLPLFHPRLSGTAGWGASL